MILHTEPGIDYMPVIPDTREVEVGGSRSIASLSKFNTRPYLKNKVKSKRAGGMVEC
jgi:hypothetical protein